MKTRHISYLFWILTLLLALPVSAQKMTVESMVYDPFDQTANLSENMYKDNNQEYGGLVKVMVASPNATFEGWVLKQQTHSASEYWVSMAKGSDRLKVTVPGYLPLEVDFNNYNDCIVKSLHTYILTITLPQAAVAGPVDDGMRYLAMTVEPKNCTVLVDGQPQMVEDGNVMVNLHRGTHRYQVSATGYNTEEGTVELKDGKETLSIRLKSSMATLRVECPTSGAKIYVNDLQRGAAPWNGSFVAGIYKVEARLDGYRSQQQSVTLSENENRTLRLPALEMIIGSLDVKVSPINSDVYIDGKKIGTTPDVFRDIQVGQHRVEIRKDGYETMTKTVTINENEQASVTGTLKAIVASTPSTRSRSSSGSSMSKTDAIGVLLSRQGNMDAARKALLPQEINDIEVVGALNNKSDEANQIINQLKSGDITPAEAKKRMQELDKSGGGNFGYGDGGSVGGGPMTKTIAIRILLGERLGKPDDAEKLLGADAKTVRNIRSTYSKLPEARKEKAAPIIEQLKSGALTPAAAAQKLSKIINGR